MLSQDRKKSHIQRQKMLNIVFSSREREDREKRERRERESERERESSIVFSFRHDMTS